MRPKYRVVRDHPLLLLQHLNGASLQPLLYIKTAFACIDLDFYHEQNWAYTSRALYTEGLSPPKYIVLNTKEEVNAALVQAEINHRLSI